MTDLPLTKVSETATTITLGWTPIPCLGYIFYADDRRVSHTLDPARSKVKFSKGATTYKVVAVSATAEGVYPPVVTPPPSNLPAVSTPTSRTVLQPNTYASQDGPESDYQACWLGGNGKGNGMNDDDIVFSRDGRGPWWFIHHFRIGTEWPTGPQTGEFPPKWGGEQRLRYQGEWGRLINFHVPASMFDVGTSSFAVDYINGILMAHNERNNVDYRLHPGLLLKDVWHTLVMKVVFSDAGQGSFVAWLDGNDQPANAATNLSTVYNGQPSVLFWNGFYTRGLKDGYTLPFSMMYPRRGKTFAEALADTSPKALGGIWGSPQPVLAWELANKHIPNSGPDTGPSTVTRVADTTSEDLLLPPSLVKTL